MQTLVRVGARISAVGFVVVAIAACALQRAQEASDAQTAMVGMSKEQVLACMGSPANAATAGNTEVWTYNSGDNRTDSFGTATAWGGWGTATAFGSSVTTARFCKVDVVMNVGRVSRINYTGPTGGLLTKGEQCGYAVDNCVHQASAGVLPVAPQSPMPTAPQISGLPVAKPVALETKEYTPPSSACSNEDQELARVARENGYRYQSSCH